MIACKNTDLNFRLFNQSWRALKLTNQLTWYSYQLLIIFESMY